MAAILNKLIALPFTISVIMLTPELVKCFPIVHVKNVVVQYLSRLMPE
jgi:hypothetical protein